jgi:hypothetical protein
MIRSFVIGAIVLASAGSAVAQPITGAQVDAVGLLAKRAVQLQQELNTLTSPEAMRVKGSASGDQIEFLECFSLLREADGHLSGDLRELLLLTAVSQSAVNKFDQETAIKFTRISLEDTSAGVALIHGIVDAPHPQICAGSALYQEETQKLKDLAADTEAARAALSASIGSD